MEARATEANGRKWHDLYPELGTGPIPIEPYVSREYFEREREQIFRRVWLNVGRVGQIPNPGDYFVKDLAVCHTSILVVRGNDGKVHVFHNMCSHRGNQVVWDAKGRCKAFTCKFHSWTYGLDGSLRHVPDEKNFFGLKKEALGLTPVAVDTWEGFIFINLDLHPKETLAEYLGEVGRSFAGYPFDAVSTGCFSWEVDLNANWKVCKDAFQEVYHIFSLHHKSTGAMFASKANPYLHAHELALFGRHARISVPANLDWQPTPVESLAKRYGILTLQTGQLFARDAQGCESDGCPGLVVLGLCLFPQLLPLRFTGRVSDAHLLAAGGKPYPVGSPDLFPAGRNACPAV